MYISRSVACDAVFLCAAEINWEPISFCGNVPYPMLKEYKKRNVKELFNFNELTIKH